MDCFRIRNSWFCWCNIITWNTLRYKQDSWKVKEREEAGKQFTIIVVAEGAKPKDGEVVVSKIVDDSPDPIRLGGIANKLAIDLEGLIKNHEIRSTVLGHIQRGEIPLLMIEYFPLNMELKLLNL